MAINVFISYAHEDIVFRQELETILLPMQDEGLISTWHDGAIEVGTEWDDAIRTNLDQSEVVILLLSRYFNSSRYILDSELPNILTRKAQGAIEVIPIMVRPINIGSTKIKHLQCLPQDEKQRLKAVSLWQPVDLAWMQIDTKIREILKQFTANLSAKTPALPTPATPPNKFFHFGEHHIYTCDRVVHQSQFNLIAREFEDHKIQYYYLYGEEIQSHGGFFKRIAHGQRGVLEDYLNTSIAASRQVIHKEIPFASDLSIEGYQVNVIKSILATFGIQPNTAEPLLEKNIAYAIDKSKELQNLTNQDYICLLLRINEYDWDSSITPDLVKSLIESFFESCLAAHHPRVLVFFGLIYEEDDSEIETEVLAAIKEGAHLKILPELQRVEERDIKKWFAQYRRLFQSTANRKQFRQTFFQSAEDFNMENIEIHLSKILDKYNKNKGPL